MVLTAAIITMKLAAELALNAVISENAEWVINADIVDFYFGTPLWRRSI
jgi:hypothetical protein